MQRKRKEKKHAAFLFSNVAKEEIFGNILKLHVSKACQDTNIPSKISRRRQTSLPAFYILALMRLLLTRNFHQF